MTDDDINYFLEKEDIINDGEKDYFYFIMSVLYRINYDMAEYSDTVNLTIWLTKGNHHLFQCKETIELIDAGTLNHNSFCAIPSLRMF